ncbi:hypothetical protein AMS68_004517 [Peltaster fructicola]|uniref:Phosphatidic acid phosphatase type 2/haloperoxidase domain-containing protein n=1 Tax=Peltaster fructicola TaxID=286661 RepID=A0A6H0XX49_9PEZI|nr:hypothetical protein AMS68_004517 [Peltaster fructicola]
MIVSDHTFNYTRRHVREAAAVLHMTSIKEDVSPPAVHLSSPSPKVPDAGLKGLDHYKQRLPPWRHTIRAALIPIVRYETPYLAEFQAACRSSFLDSYFAMTANLGTHTFFMAALPICYWCGFPSIGMALVQMLALGVYFSGYMKDMLCLPRPLSPPLQRITMSGSAALEYGFPSTHTTNAVSVAIFCLWQLEQSKSDLTSTAYHAWQALFWTYGISISIGRIYCGMHGLFDVVVGAVLGALIAWVRIAFGDAFDQWILDGDFTRPLVVGIILLLAVRFHAEPADDCPCFDDSVAFAGVVLGIEAGAWSYGQSASTASTRTLSQLYPYKNDDIVRSVARVVGGITSVFVWRAAMKPILLASLPPIFRFVDHWGLRLPRRYFLQARHYGKVPPLPKDDNVLPPASKIPGMLTTLPNRKRTISVGPQSEADVREFIANREQRRRNSRSDRSPSSSRKPDISRLSVATTSSSALLPSPSDEVILEDGVTPTASWQQVKQADNTSSELSPQTANGMLSPFTMELEPPDSKEEEQQNQRMFDALERPRVRYDVEVICKLIVYSGIAWLVVAGNPVIFNIVGIA